MKAGPDPGKHWAFQPVKLLAVPAATGMPRPSSETRSTPSSAPLSKKASLTRLARTGGTLIRRAYLDLTGLPPTAAEVEAFENDANPKAWRKSSIACSPRRAMAERWGRYWLDLARYADTKGYVFQEDRNFPYAYTYRDYVIRSFNDDKPYDQFVIEQPAADKLDLGEDRRPLAALGFPDARARFLGNVNDIIDDRIDVTTRADGSHRDVCPLPRPQVRPDPNRGLLFPPRRLRKQHRTARASTHRGGRTHARTRRL